MKIQEFKTDKKKIVILGAGPSLKQIPYPPQKDCFVIYLNAAFLRFKYEHGNIDKGLFCDIRFAKKKESNLYKFLNAGGKIFSSNLSLPMQCVYKFAPSRVIFKTLNKDKLLAGHSSFIPALHFACLLNPEKIIVLGVDLNNRLHWQDDKKYALPNKMKPFRCWKDILAETKAIVQTFPQIEIASLNPKSLLVEHGIINIYDNTRFLKEFYYG